MSPIVRFIFAVLFCGGVCFCAGFRPERRHQGRRQAGAAQPADAAKETQRQIDEFAEASRMVTGPAGNPECVWLGRRVVGLMWRDDMDTAFRHLDLYDRFGCPGPHIQSAFRCVVRQGNSIDPKSPQSLNARVHSCWLNPPRLPPPQRLPPASPASPPTLRRWRKIPALLRPLPEPRARKRVSARGIGRRASVINSPSARKYSFMASR